MYIKFGFATAKLIYYAKRGCGGKIVWTGLFLREIDLFHFTRVGVDETNKSTIVFSPFPAPSLFLFSFFFFPPASSFKLFSSSFQLRASSFQLLHPACQIAGIVHYTVMSGKEGHDYWIYL